MCAHIDIEADVTTNNETMTDGIDGSHGIFQSLCGFFDAHGFQYDARNSVINASFDLQDPDAIVDMFVSVNDSGYVMDAFVPMFAVRYGDAACKRLLTLLNIINLHAKVGNLSLDQNGNVCMRVSTTLYGDVALTDDEMQDTIGIPLYTINKFSSAFVDAMSNDDFDAQSTFDELMSENDDDMSIYVSNDDNADASHDASKHHGIAWDFGRKQRHS